MLNNVTDRLSMLGTGPTGVISMNGSTELVGALATGTSSPSLGFSGLVPEGRSMTALPEGMTGFVSGGYIANALQHRQQPAGRRGGQQLAYGSMGLEIEAATNLTVGTAFGYAYGFSAPGEVRQDRIADDPGRRLRLLPARRRRLCRRPGFGGNRPHDDRSVTRPPATRPTTCTARPRRAATGRWSRPASTSASAAA